MTKLYLYTTFHANLKFSSIPEDQYSSVLDRCYWPILDSLNDYNINLGFEFPASTLEIINSIDSGFVESLKKYWDEGRCEVLGSGYSQTIFPLNPAKANLMNLLQGNRVYKKILGNVPLTGYVNEQTFSAGLVGLYKEMGYKNIMVDWDNANKFKNYPNEYKYGPKILVGADGSRMNLIWNSSIAFQKFQRYAQGLISFEDYLSYLNSHFSPEKDRSFLLYGYDLEIFDYRPGHGDLLPSIDSSNEFQRIFKLFDYIEKQDHLELITPGEVVDRFASGLEVKLGSSEYPIICKKQDKYNVTRWAVCGRENSLINGQCYHIFNQIENIESLNRISSGKKLDEYVINQKWLELTNLWSSDFRTHTTDEKYIKYRNDLGAVFKSNESILNELKRDLDVEDDFLLVNPHKFHWKFPFEFKLQFEHGKFRGELLILLEGKEIKTQMEQVEYYRDGSIRSVKIVIRPLIKPFSYVQGRVTVKSAPGEEETEELNVTLDRIKTPKVELELSPSRGGTIKEMIFPEMSEKFLIGELSHGYFDNITFSPDWYSGHTVIHNRTTQKYSDLNKAQSITLESDRFPIRIPVFFHIQMPIGFLLKKYFVYVDEPRVDLRYHFSLDNILPLSFRLGIATANPKAFDKENLKYSTVNGGKIPEIYLLRGKTVNQDDPVNLSVSTQHCLGSTEGWVDISDNKKGLAIISQKSKFYSVPLLHYQEIKDSFFLRIYNSISEMDDTTENLLKGHNEMSFTFYGHKNELKKVRRISTSINSGLILIMK